MFAFIEPPTFTDCALHRRFCAVAPTLRAALHSQSLMQDVDYTLSSLISPRPLTIVLPSILSRYPVRTSCVLTIPADVPGDIAANTRSSGCNGLENWLPYQACN